jgi:hypothetical protein
MPAFLTKEGSDFGLDNALPLDEQLKVIEPIREGFLESVKVNSVGDMDEFEHVVPYGLYKAGRGARSGKMGKRIIK